MNEEEFKDLIELFETWWYQGNVGSNNPFDTYAEGRDAKFWAFEGYMAGKLNKGAVEHE